MPNYPKVTFTVTSSRRPWLFRRMMRSFLEHCDDRDLIADWICVDDRTAPEELDRLREMYPFLKIVSSPRPGQAAALNLLFSMVKTEWVAHSEDDWLYIRKGHFIRQMFDVTRVDQRVRNVILRFWNCPYVKRGGVEYRLHVYNHGLGEKIVAQADSDWFGYSLNPGLQHLPTIRLLGEYDEDTLHLKQFFDRPQAEKYHDLGFRRASLPDNYVIHIGEQVSSYDL